MVSVNLDKVNKLIESGNGDTGRLEHIKKSLESNKKLYSTDLMYVTNLLQEQSQNSSTDTLPSSINSITIRYAEDGVIKSETINPKSLTMQHGEELLWDCVADTKGIFRKKVTKRLTISNYRLMSIDVENQRIIGHILLQELDDVVVLNSHRVSENVGYSVYVGRFGKYGGFGGPRFSRGTSKTIGDLVFIVNGQKATWSGLPDPSGLRTFVKAIKKHMYDELKKLEKKSTKTSGKSRSGVDCEKCGHNNPKRAKFCSKCGGKLSSICMKCNKTNPIGSSFCNHCGMTLQ